MKMPPRTIPGLGLALIIALAAVAVALFASDRGSSARTGDPSTLTVENATVGPPIPRSFVGLTTEYRGLEAYAGANPAALDPVFEQLVRNLAPGQSPILRIGGDSTDWTWWPVPHMGRPGGIKYSLNRTWLQVAATVARNLSARLLLGINFEADSGRVAAAEAQALIAGIGRGRIQALELGNEPELYGSFAWYKLPNGQHVRGRSRTYSYGDFVQDFGSIARALPSAVTVAGPSMGAPLWIPLLGKFLSANRRVGLATLHRYPLKHCSSAARVTIPEILSDASSTGLAASVAGAVATAHRRGVGLRIDEMSAISCGGVAGISNSFATALWSLDALFAMARVGVDGVNMQTAPRSFNEIFTISQAGGAWQAAVHPAYYGLLMFAQAAPPGSRLLRISGSSGSQLRAWATRATNGDVRVVLINNSLTGASVVKLGVPATGTATLERLLAPSPRASQRVTLGGQSFGPETSTGLLAGSSDLTFAKPVAGRYLVTVPAASAALLTVAAK
ncbi:MAG TPA: glycosyl hydrolase family 79 C-terminal domain-containing protein [Solirubrobacteraceae bacterium]|nr:glycosyl hydrolase family 79 C-terminal domain-containing protein [Solirubrobacteraceae bacterium]